MTHSEREYLSALEQRVRDQQRRLSRVTRSSLLMAAVVAMVVLSGSIPRNSPTAVESRLAVLESLIRPGQDGSLEVKAPFKVLGGGGRILLNVAPNSSAGLVSITQFAGRPGGILLINGDGGKNLINLGVNPEGHGRAATMDAEGKVVSILGEHGLAVFNTEGKQVAGVTRGEGHGRLGIVHNDQWVTELTSDQQGNGRVKTLNAAGKVRAVMYGESGLGVFDDEEKSVVSILNRNGRGVVGVGGPGSPKLVAELAVDSNGGGSLLMKAADGRVAIGLSGTRRTIGLANPAGQTVADIAVSTAGNGLFQVWSAGGKLPLALIGKSVDTQGGILQISNGNVVTTNLTVSGAGNGYWQLNDAAGDPMVEAGVTAEKRGLLRAGPMVKCAPAKSVMGFTRVPDCIHGRLPD